KDVGGDSWLALPFHHPALGYQVVNGSRGTSYAILAPRRSSLRCFPRLPDKHRHGPNLRTKSAVGKAEVLLSLPRANARFNGVGETRRRSRETVSSLSDGAVKSEVVNRRRRPGLRNG